LPIMLSMSIIGVTRKGGHTAHPTRICYFGA
jgi:hypothetical protein